MIALSTGAIKGIRFGTGNASASSTISKPST